MRADRLLAPLLCARQAVPGAGRGAAARRGRHAPTSRVVRVVPLRIASAALRQLVDSACRAARRGDAAAVLLKAQQAYGGGGQGARRDSGRRGAGRRRRGVALRGGGLAGSLPWRARLPCRPARLEARLAAGGGLACKGLGVNAQQVGAGRQPGCRGRWAFLPPESGYIPANTRIRVPPS